MLDALRRGANTYPAKALMVVLIASFGVWGVSSSLNLRSNITLASVGESTIEPQRFQRTYQRQIEYYSQQTGHTVTSAKAVSLGLPQMVLNQLVSEAAVAEAARKLGLGISDQRLADAVRLDENFKGLDGKFDAARYTAFLRGSGQSEQSYLKSRKLAELRGQIGDGFIANLPASAALDEAIYAFRNEVRSINYVVVPASSIGTIEPPTDAELKGYFDANKANYALPEFRKVAFIKATPETLADPAAVTDADAKTEYDRTLASYGTPEKRHLRQLILPDDRSATVLEALKTGKSLDDAADAAGLKAAITDLGAMARSEIIDPAVGDAAFALSAGATSGEISGKFGKSVLQVVAVQPASYNPFEDVKAAIKTRLALDRASRLLLSTYDKIEEARAGGTTLTEIATKFNLKLVTVDAMSRSGRDVDGKQITDLPTEADIIAPAFKADVGQQTDPVSAGKSGFIWLDVLAITPKRDRTLDEIKPRVTDDWTNAESFNRLQKKAEDLKAGLEAGRSFADLAPDLKVETATGFARNATPQGALSQGVIQAAFSVAKGQAAISSDANGDALVLQVTSVVSPPYVAGGGVTAQEKGRVEEGVRNDLLSQFVDRERTLLGTSYNQALLDQLVGGNRIDQQDN